MENIENRAEKLLKSLHHKTDGEVSVLTEKEAVENL